MTYRKLELEFRNLKAETPLAMSVKALKNTMDTKSLVPSALVFGEYPQTCTKSENIPARKSLVSRSEVANAAKKEMEVIMAKMRIDRSLKHSFPSAVDDDINIGEEVLFWTEMVVKKRIGESMGPYTVRGMDPEHRLI